MTQPQPQISSGLIEPDHPEHPDHLLFEQIVDGVQHLDRELGLPYDESSQRMAARLLPLAKAHGFQRVDHVVLSRHLGEIGEGENVFVVCGELDDPGHHRAHVSTDEATRTAITDSWAELDRVNRRLALRPRK